MNMDCDTEKREREGKELSGSIMVRRTIDAGLIPGSGNFLGGGRGNPSSILA